MMRSLEMHSRALFASATALVRDSASSCARTCWSRPKALAALERLRERRARRARLARTPWSRTRHVATCPSCSHVAALAISAAARFGGLTARTFECAPSADCRIGSASSAGHSPRGRAAARIEERVARRDTQNSRFRPREISASPQSASRVMVVGLVPNQVNNVSNTYTNLATTSIDARTRRVSRGVQPARARIRRSR